MNSSISDSDLLAIQNILNGKAEKNTINKPQMPSSLSRSIDTFRSSEPMQSTPNESFMKQSMNLPMQYMGNESFINSPMNSPINNVPFGVFDGEYSNKIKENYKNGESKDTSKDSSNDESKDSSNDSSKSINRVVLGLIIVFGFATAMSWNECVKYYIARSIKFGKGSPVYYIYYALLVTIFFVGIYIFTS